MFKTTSIIISKNILIKIKSLGENAFLVWFFGPISVVKITVSKVLSLSVKNQLLIIVFYLFDVLLSKKIAYCESVAHSLKHILFNTNKSYLNYMRIKGVGYKLENKSAKEVIVTFGYSHKINIKVPSYIKICILKKRVVLWSYSLTKLQEFCHILTNLRRRDPYNGKGILQPHLQKKLKIGKISRV